MVDIDGIDLLDLDLFTAGDPHAVWSVLRDQAPLHHQVMADGREFWSVTRYDDVCSVLGDHRRFTSERGTIVTHLGENDIAAGKLMTSTDPPRHTQVRRAIGERLTTRAVAPMEDRIRQSIATFLDPAISGEIWDLAEAARLLPMLVAGPLLGIPERDWRELVTLSGMVAAPADPEFQCGSQSATLTIAHHEIISYITDWVQQKRAVGGEDGSLLDHLMSVKIDDVPLNDDEIAFDGYSLLLGANATTPHTVSGTVLALVKRPDQFAMVRANHALVPGLVEEGLRWTSAATNFMRYAVTDAEIGGGTVPAGGAVVAWIGSANRDPTKFLNPHVFDVRRTSNRHIAFGFGPHYCIGAPLARLTARIFFEELTTQFVSVELGGQPRHLRSFFIAGLANLPIVARK
ncbi:cytochrome P450 [Rhodococcus sp. NPDC080181]|uniref:cytochrome P450 n=1 Tax=Rhodococcus sp. NPDC080181 TaxID=3155292 RepID=UPI00344F76B2